MKNVVRNIELYKKQLLHVGTYYNQEIPKEELVEISNKHFDNFLNMKITKETQMLDIYNEFKVMVKEIGKNLSLHQSIGIGMSETFKNVGINLFGEDIGRIELIGPEVYFGSF
ncbi:MAG: hypothetical protein ACRC92_27055 [Peptostreptococcaceae bacterium]